MKSIALTLIFAVLPARTPHKMKAPGYLSTAAREQLDARMESHGISVMNLSISVVTLDFDEAALAAKNIVSELKVLHIRDTQNTLDAALPPRFFELQDQLRERAQKLADAATKRNTREMSAAYARMSETCIACHSVYLNGSEDPIDLNR